MLNIVIISTLESLEYRLLVWSRHAQAHWENSFPWLWGMTVLLCVPHPQSRPIPTPLSESLTSVVYIFQPPLRSAFSSWVWLVEYQRVEVMSYVPLQPAWQSYNTIPYHCPLVLGIVTAPHCWQPLGNSQPLKNAFNLIPSLFHQTLST